MSLHELFLFFFWHVYCFLQFLEVFIRLTFQSSCLWHLQWGWFRILIGFINKIFKFLIKMLIYFWKILSLSCHICNFFIYDFQIRISFLPPMYQTSFLNDCFLIPKNHRSSWDTMYVLWCKTSLWSFICLYALGRDGPIFSP